MANLADIAVRQNNASRITNNRDVVLPGKRNTDNGNLEVNATIGSGRRSNAGADELMKTLGIVSDAVSKPLGQIGAAKTKANQDAADAADGAQGANDALAGKPDEQKLKDSAVYRDWYAKGKADTTFAITHERIDASIKERMNSKQDANGDGKWDILDIQDIIAGEVKAAAFDADGKPIDFGSPEGTLQFGKQMLDANRKWMAEASDRFTAEAKEDALNNSVGSLVAGFTATGTYDLDTWVKQLPGIVDRKAAMTAGLKTIIAHAEASDDPDHLGKSLAALNGLLDAKQPGTTTPVLGYEAAATVRQQAEAIKAKRERRITTITTERHKEGSKSVLEGMIAGKTPSIMRLREMVKDDLISPEFGNSQINAIESAAERAEAKQFRNEQRTLAASDRATEQSREWTLAAMANDWKAGLGPGNDREALAAIEIAHRNGLVLEPEEQAQLLMASRNGIEARRKNPEITAFKTDLNDRIKPKTGSGAVAGAYKGLNAGGVSPEMQAAVNLTFWSAIDRGETAAAAHAGALKVLATAPAAADPRAAAKSRADALRAKAGAP